MLEAFEILIGGLVIVIVIGLLESWAVEKGYQARRRAEDRKLQADQNSASGSSSLP
jgi:hypothetical protein